MNIPPAAVPAAPQAFAVSPKASSKNGGDFADSGFAQALAVAGFTGPTEIGEPAATASWPATAARVQSDTGMVLPRTSQHEAAAASQESSSRIIENAGGGAKAIPLVTASSDLSAASYGHVFAQPAGSSTQAAETAPLAATAEVKTVLEAQPQTASAPLKDASRRAAQSGSDGSSARALVLTRNCRCPVSVWPGA